MVVFSFIQERMGRVLLGNQYWPNGAEQRQPWICSRRRQILSTVVRELDKGGQRLALPLGTKGGRNTGFWGVCFTLEEVPMPSHCAQPLQPDPLKCLY